MAKEKIARRQFMKQSSQATALAATAVAATSSRFVAPVSSSPTKRQTAAAQSQSRNALADYDLRDRQFDSRQFSLSAYDGTKPVLSFSAKNAAQTRLWQKQVRGKLTEMLGGFPLKRVALRPQVLEKKVIGDYVREKIVFQSQDNLSAFGYLLLPKDQPRPMPVVVCLPGHGRGCDDIVGIAEDGAQRQIKSGYAKDFALQVVEQGYAAFALELLAFGVRRDDAARKKGPAQSSCQPAAGAALLFGKTMLGWRVWDVMRTLDYLGTRPEVDSGRIATMGISGGGTVSLFSAALDQRIKISVVSCYLNTFRDSIVSISHCIDNYVPGILNYVEMSDIAGLIAPRALFAESGARDRIFPVDGSTAAFKEAQHIYQIAGATEKIGHEVFDGEHEFHGTGAFEFLKKWL